MLVTCPVCQREFRRADAHARRTARNTCSRACRAQAMTGAGHWLWQGGTYLDKDGYRRVWTPDRGYVLEHRLVLERRIGRRLLPHEAVHHRNDDRLDNRPGNLELCVGHGDHSLAHHVTRVTGGHFASRAKAAKVARMAQAGDPPEAIAARLRAPLGDVLDLLAALAGAPPPKLTT